MYTVYLVNVFESDSTHFSVRNALFPLFQENRYHRPHRCNSNYFQESDKV